MKIKLAIIQTALENAVLMMKGFDNAAIDEMLPSYAKNLRAVIAQTKVAATLVDSITEALDSQEMVEKVAEAICDSHPDKHFPWKPLLTRNDSDIYKPQERYIKITRKQAQAVINTIKGE